MKNQREGGFLIAKVHHMAGRIFAKKLQEHEIEINPAQGRIMFVLWDEDGLPINELAQRTSLAKSTLTSMLDRLEEAGHVVRARSRDDRRKILVHRTEKDRAWQETYVQVSQEMSELFYAGLSEGEIDAFEGYLRRVLDNLIAVEAETA